MLRPKKSRNGTAYRGSGDGNSNDRWPGKIIVVDHFCLPMLWRLYRKKGKSGHQSRPLAAAKLARKLAEANPNRSF
ncbi:MAG: hypothetical protein ACXVB5_17055, partial [Isosphaeraceae bacterium]